MIPGPFTGNVSGIYQIRNTVNGKTYVGSTTSLRRRRAEHLRELAAGRHFNPILQRAWAKYGAQAFVFEVVEVCPREDRHVREQHYLDTLAPAYNVMKVAGEIPVYGATDAMREAVRRHATGNTYRVGKKHSPETIELLRQVHKGVIPSQETKDRRSASLMGRVISQKTVDATIQRNKDRVWTEESRNKLAESQSARFTPEARAHLTQINTGKKASDETKAKMSESRRGKTASEETKKRMAEARAAFWARKKAEKESVA